MPPMPMYIATGVGTLLILLGFVALLAQRIYIDPGTGAPTEIEIPILGKMKANYPALIFVFLGCGVVLFGLGRYEGLREVPWHIDGFITTDVERLNWQAGRLAVFPSKVEMGVDAETGRFWIDLDIEEGKTFEDVVQRIDYTHLEGNMQLIPSEQFDLYKRKDDKVHSQLTNATPNSRTYRALLQHRPKPITP